MKKMESLHDFFEHELKDLYSAEKQLLKALPQAAEKASASHLKTALQDHFKETEGHVNRLETVFKHLGMEPKEIECKAMKGILKEAEEILHSNADPEVRDAAIIGGAQKAEHYEIAGYGTLTTWAKQMGADKEVTRLLHEILEEEEKADAKLTRLAKEEINVKAAQHH